MFGLGLGLGDWENTPRHPSSTTPKLQEGSVSARRQCPCKKAVPPAPLSPLISCSFPAGGSPHGMGHRVRPLHSPKCKARHSNRLLTAQRRPRPLADHMYCYGTGQRDVSARPGAIQPGKKTKPGCNQGPGKKTLIAPGCPGAIREEEAREEDQTTSSWSLLAVCPQRVLPLRCCVPCSPALSSPSLAPCPPVSPSSHPSTPCKCLSGLSCNPELKKTS